MAKPLRVAGEVDGWCTRCRLLLNHRIVSMKSGKPHQVECLTCRSTHLWRPKPPGEKVASESPRSTERRAGAPQAGSRTTRVSAAARLEETWAKATLGRDPRDFKAYSVAGNFDEGDLVRHKKFGDGVLTRIIDAKKIEVLFRDEPKTLAQGTT